MTMGDTNNSEAAATMEKLELLSATALLKQGIDGAPPSSTHPAEEDGKDKNRILATPSFGQTVLGTSSANSPFSISSVIPKPIFSVASSTSVSGLLMQGASSPEEEAVATNKTSHLASPVSADGDEELPNSGLSRTTEEGASAVRKAYALSGPTLQASVSTHSLQQIIESRSPASSVEFHRQQVLDAPTPPPSGTYRYPLYPRYEAPASFRPPMDSSAFSAFDGAALGGEGGVDSGYFAHHHPQAQQRQMPSPHPHHKSIAAGGKQEGHVGQAMSYDDMAREMAFMREQLKEKDMVVSSLQHRVNFLENKITELRQLPTGKISHIPVDDMIRIMQEYGSEVSNQTLPQRKSCIKKASIVRQFRRWNPEFFQYFIHVNGEWVPKLGRDAELRRRADKRRLLKHQQPKVTK